MGGLTEADRKAIREMRERTGAAIVVFNPEELHGVLPCYMENALVEHGNEIVGLFTL